MTWEILLNTAFSRLTLATVLALAASPALAQFGKQATKGASLGEAKATQYQAGMRIKAGGNSPCKGLNGTLPVPVEWPEQTVKIIKEDISPGAQVTYRAIEGAVQQMVISVPFLPAGEEATVVVTYEIKRHAMLAPEKPTLFILPEKLSTEERLLLAPSIGIECRSTKIRTLAKDLIKDKGNAWEKVEALYDYSRNNVELKQSPFKGAMEALKDKDGDVEDIAALFIALCRAVNIPARTVWVPGTCYAEFMLADDEGKHHWLPCLMSGERSFGAMKEPWPILQKGDNFRVPENPKSMVRFVPEQLTGKGGKPIVKFIREVVDVGGAKKGL